MNDRVIVVYDKTLQRPYIIKIDGEWFESHGRVISYRSYPLAMAGGWREIARRDPNT